MENLDWKEKLGLAFNIDPASVQNEQEEEILMKELGLTDSDFIHTGKEGQTI